MHRMNERDGKYNGRVLADEAEAMAEYVGKAFRDGLPVHEVEQGLWRQVLKMGRISLEGYIEMHGDGEHQKQTYRKVCDT